MKSLNKIKASAGVNIVEVMVAIFISAILVIALVSIYAYGIRQFNLVSSQHLMTSEAMAVLKQIEKYIRMSESVYVIDNVEPNRTRLTLTLPDIKEDGSGGGEIEFFYNKIDRTLRKHDRRVGVYDFNMQVLPIISRSRMRRFGPRWHPYHVKKIHFQYADTLAHQVISGPQYLVKIDLVVEDTLGNSLALSSVTSRLN